LAVNIPFNIQLNIMSIESL